MSDYKKPRGVAEFYPEPLVIRVQIPPEKSTVKLLVNGEPWNPAAFEDRPRPVPMT
jgi:hypothetical protein